MKIAIPHTPGPWKVKNERKSISEFADGRHIVEAFEVDVRSTNGAYICSIKKTVHLKENALADAKLIAAAPDMLLLLREAKSYLKDIPHLHALTMRIDQLIKNTTK